MERMTKNGVKKSEVFHFVMIKPTHYDDEGYPIQWAYSPIPSNSLASVNGLALDCAQRRVLGDNVEIKLHAFDETKNRVKPKKIINMIKRSGGKCMIGFVGVQSNQFPRTVDLAQPFLEAGLPVCVGGFHISGCLSMLPELPSDIKAAQDMGICFFAGEAEDGRMDEVLIDAYNGQLKPLYNYLKDLPDITDSPIPILHHTEVDKKVGSYASFDIGRGCPFECSFCTIINVHGRKSRFRTADDLEKIVRENIANGVNKFFVTDDNLARNKNWEDLFDRLIHLRENEGIRVKMTIQVDTLCHRIPNFIEKAAKAGVHHCFIGLENINPDNLLAAKKRQNKITEYREMLLEWKKYPIFINAGYILGFPNDTRESILNDIEIIKRELPIDILYFFFLTPLPGSEDHRNLAAEGAWMDPDMNKYDLNQRVSHHSGSMSDEEWEAAHRDAWGAFYTQEHMETVIRRLFACGGNRKRVPYRRLAFYNFFPRYWPVHPLEGGFVPRRYRKDRRPTFKRESVFVFYPRYFAKFAVFNFRFFRLWHRLGKFAKKLAKDPKRFEYTDLALTPPGDGEYEDYGLFAETRGGQAAVEKKQRHDEIKERVIAAE